MLCLSHLRNHLVLVASDVCCRATIGEIEHGRYVEFAFGYAQVLRDQSPQIFCKRNLEFLGPCLRPSPDFRVEANLNAAIHCQSLFTSPAAVVMALRGGQPVPAPSLLGVGLAKKE